LKLTLSPFVKVLNGNVMTNQASKRIWRLGVGYPSISYSGERPKIEGKKLANALEYDAKHHI
jgi:hypothetical protein